MTCCELFEFLCDYLDGDLPEAQRKEFESHLALCPPCVTYLETYRATITLGKACGSETPAEKPPKLPEDLVKAILAASKKA